MSAKDRQFSVPSADALHALREKKREIRRRKITASDASSSCAVRAYITVASADPVSGAVRAYIEHAMEADGFEPVRRGPKRKRENLLRILDYAIAHDHPIGRIDGATRNIGTAENGSLVQGAAKALKMSPQQVRDLVRQIADIAGKTPGGVTGNNPPRPS